MSTGLTLFEKIWNAHVVTDLGGGMQLLHVDRHYLLDLGGSRYLAENAAINATVRNPELTFATADHLVSTEPGRTGGRDVGANEALATFRRETKKHAIRLFDVNDAGQGIVHVVGPEQGLTLPGTLIACADSHTCTNGALGAVAFGMGGSELKHILATQTIIQRRPKTLRVRFNGTLGPCVGAKDMALALIGQVGVSAGTGYAVEYVGEAVNALSAEERMTLCNLSVEFGARIGLVAPDENVFDYLRGRPYAPKGDDWNAALAQWRELKSDDGARFDKEVAVDIDSLAPQITWGVSPEEVIPVDGDVPEESPALTPEQRAAMKKALAYMGLEAGQRLAGTRVDRVFIGSCTNARLPDLRAAAAIARGRKVSPQVKAWVVPGSQQVKREAEREGLDQVFLSAGFEWREPGCSMCVAANGDVVEPGARCISTANRNFVGRQGPGARTHIASPMVAAAAAIAGEIADPRRMLLA
ncbi:MAG: 3-isopropylmalate dehydratase large subunit [Burkholderiales bacterium]